jgi:hypothetical protein
VNYRCKKLVADAVGSGRTFEKRRRTQLKFNNGTIDRGRKRKLRLESMKGQTHELEVVKRAVGISIRLRKVSDWPLWRGRIPPKRKKRRPKHSPRNPRIKMVVVHLDQLAPYQGTARDEWL